MSLRDPNGDEAGRERPLRDPHAARDGDEARKQGHDLVDDDHVGEVDLLVEGAQSHHHGARDGLPQIRR